MIALIAAAASAQQPQWTVTVDPLTTVLGFAHVQVERALHPRLSVYLGPSLRLYDGLLASVNGPYIGIGAEMGVRGFLTGAAPEGAWIMGRGVLARLSTAQEARLGGYTSCLLGYTAIVGPGLTLSGGAGVSWFDYDVGGYGSNGLAPALHTNIGWAF